MEQARANAALDGKATGEQHKDLVGLRLEDITVICQVRDKRRTPGHKSPRDDNDFDPLFTCQGGGPILERHEGQ